MRHGRRIFDELTRHAEREAARRAEKTARKAARLEDRAAHRAEREGRRREKARRHAERKAERKRRRRDRDAALTPEERERRERVARARRRANNRIGFLTHLGSYLATLALLFVTTRSVRVVLIVALGWGIGIFCHYLWAVVAPSLRDRWVEQEVGARSARDVASERRQVEHRSRRSMEDLSASIAHEIRNPITAAKSLVQQMGEDPASDENLEYADLALSELDRVERSISHLLRYARDEEPRFEPISLAAVASLATEGLRDRAAAADVELGLEFDGEGEIRGDHEKLRRVIENLISNAIDALTEGEFAPRQIRVSGGENLAGNEVWMRIVDNGPGIPPEDRDRVWSPFFTTRDAGTGLGLALTRKTVEAHGGQIELLSPATSATDRTHSAGPRDGGAGTEFVLVFPKEIGSREAGSREGRSESIEDASAARGLSGPRSRRREGAY